MIQPTREDSSSRGVLYVAIGESFRQEARRSLASLRRWHPDWPVTLVTDEVDAAGLEAFDRVVPCDPSTSGCGSKVSAMRSTPYERTLFLDTDTIVCAPLAGLFDLLDRFDFAASLEYCGLTGPTRAVAAHHEVHPPELFPEFNTGVVLFQRSEAMLSVLDHWKTLYDTYRRCGVTADQPSFRAAVYESEARYVTLPFEFNFRPLWTTAVYGPVRILHVHDHLIRGSAEELAERINRHRGVRLYVPGVGVVAPTGNVVTRVVNGLRRRITQQREPVTA